MTAYKLHCFAESGNTYKVALYLNCAGLDWEAVRVDYFNGETRDEAWRGEVNAMGEAPVLEVDGKQFTQSGAILTYLAETTGCFAAKDDDERYEVLRWLLFDNHKFTSYFATYRFFYSLAKEPGDPVVMNFLRARADASFAVVEKHLSDQNFIVGDEPTVADFSLAGYVFYDEAEHGFNFPCDYPSIDAWKQRIAALPGWVAPHELMP